MGNEAHPDSGETGPVRPLGRGRLRQTWADFRDAGHGDTNVFGQAVPFVGRRKALESLYGVVRDALNNRQVRIVWLHGEPGMGKTRLITELLRAVRPKARNVGWYELDAGR